MSTKPQYEMYEKVLINPGLGSDQSVSNEVGAIVGFSQNEDGSWYYAVHVYSREEGFCFHENELAPTGERAQHSDFYDGSSVRVTVNKQGEGRIADD